MRYMRAAAVFSIHPDTGVISLIGPLDYETRTSYLFVVKATDGAVPSTTSEVLTSEALVTMEVEGVNEWLPVWQTPGNDTEVRYVPENTMPGEYSGTSTEDLSLSLSLSLSGAVNTFCV